MKLVAEKLTCVRGGRLIFSNISFETGSGKATLVSGPNGAGKTSLLRILAGFLRPQNGSLHFEDHEHPSEDLSIGQCAHYLGHQNAIKAAMNVEENLTFWSQFLGGNSHKDHIQTCLETVELDHAREFSSAILSAGQKRRLNLARLLVVPRPLWLLDEPSSALDKEAEKILCRMMKDHLRHGGLIVASSHEDFGFKFDKELKIKSARALG